MSETNVPEGLLRYVRSDLRPVRPLALPSRRALAMLPVGAFLLLAVPWFWGLRANLPEMGETLAWGVSTLQVLVGLFVVGLALRESVPGRELSRALLASAFLGGTGLMILVTLATSASVPTVVPPGASFRFWWECFGMALAPGLLGFAFAAFLASRAWPARPAVAGALYGLGTGLMTDSGARLFCWVSSPLHVFLSHSGVVLSLVLLGAVTAFAIDRKRAGKIAPDPSEDTPRR